MWSPQFECVVGEDGEASYRVGHELVDEFLEFIAARARPNTVKAYAHDLKVFFTIVAKDPAEVTSRDVLGFVTQQRQGRSGAGNVVRISDGSAGLSAATIKRRLAAVSALYAYLVVRGDADVSANPVPRGLPTRQRRRNGPKVVPLVRGVRRLPRILGPVEFDGLLGALRTHRDRAIVQAMLLAGPAPLRGPRVAARGPAPRRVAGLHRRWQGWPRACRADLDDVLRDGRRVLEHRTPG
jgi:site-specific recombinase XerC